MKFDLQALSKSRYRYLVCDRSGEVWAFEPIPVRGNGPCEGFWVLPEHMRAPEPFGFATHDEWKKASRAYWARLMVFGRPCAHLTECPLEMSWENEPLIISEVLTQRLTAYR